MNNKMQLNYLKDLVNDKCPSVKAMIAEKNGWILIKTSERMKTVGCIRLNKNSFVTLYIDTKQGIKLEDEFRDLPGFGEVEIKSRETGNFVQNKIKLYDEGEADLIVRAINQVFEDDIVMVNKRVRRLAVDSVAS